MQNISLSQLLESGYILCWAAKWTDKKGVYSRSKGDKDFLSCLHALLCDCDAVIHYNGTKFDMPWINSEFLLAGLPPPSPYKNIDLLRTVRSQFRFPSNKLDYVATALGIGHKNKNMSMDDWKGAMNDDPKSWAKMIRYNKNDVKLTAELYFELLPWIKGHPNSSLYRQFDGRDGGMGCPKCDSKDIIARGNIKTDGAVYKRYSCKSCNSWFRGKVNISLQYKYHKNTAI